ncbi:MULTISPECIES: MmgE/PrpD family protein [unclassified Cryobacterium]|nr:MULTISPECIES: MmgE/PrpD family protein [unclassified Cryobacterium]
MRGTSTESGRRPVLHAIVDTLAVAAAASSTSLVRTVRSTLVATGPQVLWGTRQTGSPIESAFHNGVAAHALDFDDMSESVRGHLSSVLLPALFAALLALPEEDSNAAATRFSRAYAVAAQVAGSLAAGLTLDGHYRRGFHSTTTVGAIAATAGVAHLLALTPNITRNALGIAASTASGIRQNFGSDTKALQVGSSAANAIRAIQFAARGLTADADSLGGQAGFLRVFGEPAELENAVSILNGQAVVDHPGINIKLIPSCYELQRTAHAALQLRDNLPESIDSIQVTLNRRATDPLIMRYPTNGREAQFSPSFVVAAAFELGQLNLSAFTDEVVFDARISDIASRVVVGEADAPSEGGAPLSRFAAITVAGGGAIVQAVVEEAPGSALLELDRSALRRKALDCLTVLGRSDLTGRLFSAAQSLIYGGETAPIRDFIIELGRPANHGVVRPQ